MNNGSTDSWSTFSELLDDALELTGAERVEWMAALAARDPTMAARIEALLHQRDRDGFDEFLAGPSPAPAGTEAVSLRGTRVGPYLIEAEIGHGGMGSVWRARRADGRFEGSVAIKFVHAAFLGDAGERRFRTEGEFLAQLDHPHIARLIDAGMLDERQPYLVLEYVEGQPIDQYCKSRNLSLEARIRLFLDVLSAVAHAHSHLIVHRDIKPANIFVTDGGQVKLLDFGIAKLLALEPFGAALTQSNAVPLTPQYAAPEQVLGHPVTTATDVYALGLVLHLLLTDHHPIGKEANSGAEWLKAVITVEPPRPSTLPSVSAAQRRTLRGDLDNIIGKCLKKEPTSRYPTPEAFAGDLIGYLNHQPISARPDSFTYVMRKLVRRHRFQFGAASMTLLALIAGVVGTTLQANEARRQRAVAVVARDRAETLLSRNEAIFDFVDMMLTESVPQDQIAATQQMLDRSVAFIDIAAAGQPDRQAEVLRVLASYYIALENPQKAAPLLERARAQLGPQTDLSLQATLACTYADVIKLLGRTPEAIALLDQWSTDPRIDGNAAAFCLQTRAILAQNDANSKDAYRYAQAALSRVKQAAIPSERLEASLLGDVGFALFLAGRNAEAEVYYERSIAQFHRLGMDETKEARRIVDDWGIVAYGSGNFKHGLALYERLLRIQEHLSGNEPVAAGVVGNYAFGLEAVGRYPEALQEYERTFASATKTGFVVAQCYALAGRASVHVQMGEHAKAQEDIDRAKALMGNKVPEGSPARMRLMMVQSQIDTAMGRYADATKGLDRVIELLVARDASHAAMAGAYRRRAELQIKMHAPEGALEDARRAVDIAKHLQGGTEFSADTGSAYLTLGRVMIARNDLPAAREALRQAVAHLTDTVGAQHPDTLDAQRLLAYNN